MQHLILISHSYQVQERALKAVPGLCDTIDYAEVQGVLFPRVAVCPMSSYSSKHCVDIAIRPKLVFTKTRILSVKVATLVTFLAMVKTLDQVRIPPPYLSVRHD